MMYIKPDIIPNDVTNRHTLFVEGSNSDSIDPLILQILLKDQYINVEPMGPSLSLKSVAQAFLDYQPNCYFLIDRDHHDENFVNDCWNDFPNNKKQNLLVWKRREIENYFLDPNYLVKSKYCKYKKQKLKEFILKSSQKRIFIDTANQVIISIREEFKTTWVKIFTDINDFKDKDSALNNLKSLDKFKKFSNNVACTVTPAEIERRFNKYLIQMTKNKDAIELGVGQWQSMIKGKAIFSQIVNTCFEVKDRYGDILQANEKQNAIVKDLLSLDDQHLPDDFLMLKDVISRKITSKQ